MTSHLYTDVKSAKKEKSFDVMISKWGWLFQVLSGNNQKISKPGLNAYTTEDRTVYTVDIPSNELSRFLKIEGSRFRKIVNRLKRVLLLKICMYLSSWKELFLCVF